RNVKSYTIYSIPYFFPVAFLIPTSFCALEFWKPWRKGLVFLMPFLVLYTHGHRMDPVLADLLGRNYLSLLHYRQIELRSRAFAPERAFALRMRHRLEPLIFRPNTRLYVLFDDKLPIPYREIFNPQLSVRIETFRDDEPLPESHDYPYIF